MGQKSEHIKNVIARSSFRPRGHATIDKFPTCACTKVYMFVFKQFPGVGHGLTRLVCSCTYYCKLTLQERLYIYDNAMLH